jgi:predicted site-specific integrase-resolvase
LALSRDPIVTRIIVEHKRPLNPFGFRYLDTLLSLAGRQIEVVNLAENYREDLLADLVSIVYAFTARLYRQRRAKHKTAAIVKQLQEGANDE